MIESRCQEKGCTSHEASPQFTAPLSSIKKDPKTYQPKWYCEKHSPKHPRVSPLDGKPYVKMSKSYEMNGHGLRPLPRMEQYEIVRREVKHAG